MSIELQPWRRELTTRSWRLSLAGSLRKRMKRASPPHSRSFILWIRVEFPNGYETVKLDKFPTVISFLLDMIFMQSCALQCNNDVGNNLHDANC